jgi:hypothetical protein
MIRVGVGKVICRCGQEMERTGGVFGGDEVIEKDTYYCHKCEGYVLVLLPNEKHQQEFNHNRQKE